ncbi:MAG: hypothetical protein EPO21_14870 [Chloroflexota bacterium]|nr:MAG: hypothetical protein EPO21_14870 [Chloroflexota bacterium]
MSTQKARLDKKHSNHVLCYRCRQVIGTIPDDRSCVILRDGMTRWPDGIWRLSKHAEDLQRQPKANPQPGELWEAPRHRRAGNRKEEQGGRVTSLPAEIDCPHECGRRQWLDPTELNVSSDSWGTAVAKYRTEPALRLPGKKRMKEPWAQAAAQYSSRQTGEEQQQ